MKINLLKKLNNIIIISFAFLFFSCGIKPKSNSNSQLNGVSGDFYTSFYKEDGSTIYFIRPLEFLSDNEKLIADFTFLKKNDTIEDVTINFSILSTNKIASSNLNEIKINELLIKDYKILYNEPKSSKLNEIRISLVYPKDEFIKNYKDLKFKIEENHTIKEYLPRKKTLKNLLNTGLLIN